MTRARLSVTVLFLGLSVVHATTGDAVRLAGTIQLSSDAHIAIVEVPGSQQQLLHVGDEIAGGTVELIRDGEVHISIGSETLILTLEGSDTAISGEAAPRLIAVSLDVGEDDIREINNLAGSDDTKLSEQLTESLALPGDLMVSRVRIGGHMFDSLHAALPELGRALTAGQYTHLYFEAGGSIDEVYLVPIEGDQ